MSEHVTHLAVFEDSARLVISHPEIHDDLKGALRREWRAGCLGSLTRSGDKFSVGVLERLRAAWHSREPGDGMERKLAFLLGWRAHQAADRRFKPVYRQLQPRHYDFATDAPSDVTIYHDLVVFREVYDNGRIAPFQACVLGRQLQPHPVAQLVDAGYTEELLRACWQKTLLRAHRFVDAESNPEAWQKLLEARMEPFIVEVSRYEEAYAQPKPEWYQRFIVAPNFYDAGDPLIRLARALQRGQSAVGLDLKDALANASRQSQYAQAIANAVDYMLATDAFWKGRIDVTELRRRFHIGTSHLQTPAKEGQE